MVLLAEDLSKHINSILIRKWTVMMVKTVIRERVNMFGIQHHASLFAHKYQYKLNTQHRKTRHHMSL